MTTVFNLATQQKILYSCTPEQAVIAAYAQERHDWNTWDYSARYGNLLERGEHTVLIGNWSAFTCSCHSLESGQSMILFSLAGLLLIALVLIAVLSLAGYPPAILQTLINLL
jgi:hypothetical protein